LVLMLSSNSCWARAVSAGSDSMAVVLSGLVCL
jgi:hypothetical protein